MNNLSQRFSRPTLRRAITLALIPVALSCSGLALAQTAPAKGSVSSDSVIEEVTVTATRRAEPLSKVAISITAFNAEQMDSQGVKDLDALVRLTPGLNLSHQSATGANRIAIRGISSSAGSGTTGVYIDDAPIQVRNMGFGAGTAFPGLFDVERVEVLRGPQGTLFGAGSEGGTIRFITTEPSVTQQSSSVRSEIATTRNGSPTYEGGVAVGTPLIQDKLGLRVSAYYRHEGGYIDAVNGTNQILDQTGASYGQSVAFTRTQTYEKDINWNRTVALRASLKFVVNDALTITPSVFYQKIHKNDGAGDYFDVSASDLGSRDYARRRYVQGDPAQDPRLNAMTAPTNAYGDDQFTLSAIALSWNIGSMQLVSNTSYFDRTANQWFDYTKGYAEFYSPQFYAADQSSIGLFVPDGW